MYTEKADLWSVGAIVYEAVTGRQPFLADGAAEMAAVVATRLAAVDSDSGLPAFIASAPGLSDDCRTFSAACLVADPAMRPSAAELLLHPWLVPRASTSDDLAPASPTGSESRPIIRCMSEMAPSALFTGMSMEEVAARSEHAQLTQLHTVPGACSTLRRNFSSSAVDVDYTRAQRGFTERLEHRAAPAVVAGPIMAPARHF